MDTRSGKLEQMNLVDGEANRSDRKCASRPRGSHLAPHSLSLSRARVSIACTARKTLLREALATRYSRLHFDSAGNAALMVCLQNAPLKP